MTNEWVSEAIMSSARAMVWQAPYWLLELAGAVLAIVFWARSPRASCLTLIAMALMALAGIGWVMQAGVSTYLYMHDTPYETIGWTQSAIAMVNVVLSITGLSLLLSAVFVGRRSADAFTAE